MDGKKHGFISSKLGPMGVQHRVTCPHSSEQNGATETRHRRVVEKGFFFFAHSSWHTS